MTHLKWLGMLATVIALAIVSGTAQVGTIDAERLLSTRFGFTAAEIAEARGGKAVSKMLPANDATDIGVLAAVRIDAQPERLVYWLKDVTAFRNAAGIGGARRLSSPPRIEDFADLSFDAEELNALRTCREGNCALMLGDRAIQRFQTEVNWAASDAAARANVVLRQLLLAHAQAYLKDGDQALGVSQNDKTPRVFADEFHQVLWQSKTLYDIAPPVAAYLEGFPTAKLPDAEQFLYWAKGGAGPEASISLHQLIVYRAPGGAVFVADKQLYASRYVDAALVMVSLAPAPGGKGFYALAGARARSRMLSGMSARVLRGRVETVTRDAAKMYLDWIRASLAA